MTMPDFIIGGAPKCGTTSLHQVLDQHPDIWMAKNELYFFDADDPVAHQDFLTIENDDLTWRSPDQPSLRDWYQGRFAEAPKNCLIGEDTTTYLMSDVAPFRIRAAAPQSKVIFMLRDPVARAVSQYWHLLRSGRTTLSLEQAISQEPSIIRGSTYAPPLRLYRQALGKERIHVVLFEEFKADQQAELDKVTGFLGLPAMPVENVKTWHNRTRYPSNVNTLRRLNHIGRFLVRYRYARHFGAGGRFAARLGHTGYRRWFRMIGNRVLTQSHPPSDTDANTRRFLERHLSDRNAGLSELLGKDLGTLWPGFSQ